MRGAQAVQVREVSWPTTAGDLRVFNVQVMTIFDGAESSLGTKILFVDVTRQHELQEELQRSRQELETAYEELQSTNEELETTNEELQSTVEELETTNEELQSTIEELETTNEELQSTVEELETTNEELQSTNEELETTVEELQAANTELAGLNVEMERRAADQRRRDDYQMAVLSSLEYPVVVVDRAGIVTTWNAPAEQLWGLEAEHVADRPFWSLPVGDVAQKLREALRQVGDTGKAELLRDVPFTVPTGERRSLTVQVTPLKDNGGEVLGAVAIVMASDPVA